METPANADDFCMIAFNATIVDKIFETNSSFYVK